MRGVVEARMRRHGRLIELTDAIMSPDCGTQEALERFRVAREERRQLLTEIEGDLPGFGDSLMQIFELEDLYRDSGGNGAAVWRAYKVSVDAGWPCPPRWVLRYFAEAAVTFTSGEALGESEMRLALKLRPQPVAGESSRDAAGGPSAAKRLGTFKRRTQAVMRVVEVLDLLEMAENSHVVFSAERAEAQAFIAALPARVRPRSSRATVAGAAEIVAYELENISAGTLIQWYRQDTVPGTEQDEYRRIPRRWNEPYSGQYETP